MPRRGKTHEFSLSLLLLASSTYALGDPPHRRDRHQHIALRPGAQVNRLPDGRLVITEPMCGGSCVENPHVKWYCVQSSGSCGLTANATCFPPYTIPTNPTPDQPTTSGHDNVTRYWSGDPHYEVYMPNGFIDMNPNVLPTSMPLRPPNGRYRYLDFFWDIVFTMAKYSAISPTCTHPALPFSHPFYGTLIPAHPSPNTCDPCLPTPTGCSGTPTQVGIPYSARTAVFDGVATPVPTSGELTAAGTYPTSGPFPTAQIQGLIWSSALGGPTGNGRNEMILLPDTVSSTPFPGLTSMIVDPQSGRIEEADLIFFGTTTSGNWPNASVYAATSCPAYASQPGGLGMTTVIGHEVGHFFGLDHTNLHPGLFAGGAGAATLQPTATGVPSASTFAALTHLPDMVFNIMYTSGIPFGYPGGTDWRTDPVRNLHPDEIAGISELYPFASQVTSTRRPIINDRARIEGHTSFVPGAPNPFGLNVYPFVPGGPPFVGTLVGTARSAPNDVVGRSNTTTGLPTSANFRLSGVGVPTMIHLRFEPLESLGFNVAPAASYPFGEWIYDPILNPTTINRPWTVGIDGAFALTVQPRVPFPSSRGSLFVGAGTVIDLNVEWPGPFVGSNTIIEPVSRPSILVSPRTGRPVPFSGSLVTATVTHDYALKFKSAVWQNDDGVIFPASRISTTQPINPSGSTGPWTTTYQDALPAMIAATGAAGLYFRVQEEDHDPSNPTATHRPPAAIQAVIGVNEVRF